MDLFSELKGLCWVGGGGESSKLSGLIVYLCKGGVEVPGTILEYVALRMGLLG